MRTYQKDFGFVIRKMSWSATLGPNKDIGTGEIQCLDFDSDLFTHMLTMGTTKSGKGVWNCTMGLFLRDNFGWPFIDVIDPNQRYENGYYPFKQDNPLMLERLNDSFPYNKPHAYKTELWYLDKSLDQVPEFFKPFVLGWRDLRPFDFNMFYPKANADEDAELRGALGKAEDIEDFLEAVNKHVKHAWPMISTMYEEGWLDEETTLDIKSLFTNKLIHAINVSAVEDYNIRNFVTAVVLRMIYAYRVNKSYTPAVIYIREAGTVDESVFRMLATRSRHADLHILADTQRRVSMMDKTAAMQFTSHAMFNMPFDQGQETLNGIGIDWNYAKGLSNAQTGVCLLNLVGNFRPTWPLAVSPPVCAYPRPGNYFKYCRDNGVRFKDAR